MADEGGEVIRGRRPEERTSAGMAPTGSDMDSQGSSVELDAKLATEEEIPSMEEIMRKGPPPFRRPTPPRAPQGVPAEEEEEVPHDKGRMEEIE